MVTEGSANIIVTFVLEPDIADAAEDVREKAAGAMRRLPSIVQKAGPDRARVVTVAVSGRRNPREPTEIADRQLRRALETGDGVAAADISGGRNRQVNVFPDQDKPAVHNLTPQDVVRTPAG